MTERHIVQTTFAEDENNDYKVLREQLRELALHVHIPKLVTEFMDVLHTAYTQRPKDTWGFDEPFDLWLSIADVTAVFSSDQIEFFEREFSVLICVIDPWSRQDSAIGRTSIERVISNDIRARLGIKITLEHKLHVSINFRSTRTLPVFS